MSFKEGTLFEIFTILIKCNIWFYSSVMACITRDAILFFFRQDVDPNDDTLMVLMEGMAVEKNGKVYTVTSVS